LDHFEDQFLGEGHEPLGLPFDEEANFFHPEEVHDGEEFAASHPAEESIYTDDPVRVYLREMGAVPLLTRKGWPKLKLGRSDVSWVISEPRQLGARPDLKKPTALRGAVGVWDCESSDRIKGCDGTFSGAPGNRLKGEQNGNVELVRGERSAGLLTGQVAAG